MSVLEDFANLNAKLFVDGALRASEASDGFDVVDPATETTLSHVADATDAEIDEAVAAAKASTPHSAGTDLSEGLLRGP